MRFGKGQHHISAASHTHTLQESHVSQTDVENEIKASVLICCVFCEIPNCVLLDFLKFSSLIWRMELTPVCVSLGGSEDCRRPTPRVTSAPGQLLLSP